MSNPDCRPTQLCLRVSYLIRFVGDLDTAAKYARLAVFTRIKSETTITTCQSIIGAMFREKRYEDVYDLYDFFFIQHKLRPNSHIRNYIIESRFQLGLVDKALDFHHRWIDSGQFHDYPSDDTFRILTKGLVHSGRLDRAETVLRDGTTFGRIIYPDHVAFNNIIRGYLDLGNLKKANFILKMFEAFFLLAIEDKGDFYYSYYENRKAFLMATFMEYWFKQGNVVEAMACYNRFVLANRLLVCAETGNALLVVLLKYGEKDHAWALYHELLDKRRTDSDTIKIMVDECFDMGQFSEAVETFKKARAKNNNWEDRYNFTKCYEENNGAAAYYFVVSSAGHVIRRCCENGMLSEAESVFVDSLDDVLGHIESTTFKTMIDAYVKAGRIDDAIKASNKLIDAALKEISHLF